MRLGRKRLALVAVWFLTPAVYAVDFDHDGDGDVDQADAADFFGCLDGPGAAVSPDCAGHHDADGDGDVDLADFDGLQIDFGRLGTAQVARLNFTGDAFHNVSVDCPSGTCSGYGTPHWLDQNLDGDADDAGDHKYPVAFVRGTDVAVSGLEFAVWPADLDLEDVPVVGAGPDGLLFQGTGSVSNGELVVSQALWSSTPLPNSVRSYNTLDITWQVALDGVRFDDAGTTRHPVCVTFAAPMGERLETYFYISTGAAHGQDQSQAVIDAIWAEFADRSVFNVRGERLGYYRDILCASECTYYDAKTLVYFTYSQCGGWADLLIQCFRTQGIGGSQFVTIEPQGTPALPPDCAYSPSPAAGFLVKNYQFSGAGLSSCANYPYRFNDPCFFFGQWSEPDVVDLEGVPGQDNGNPASWFARHFIVKINLRYYDPSYGAGPFTGTTEQATMAWEGGAIAGYWGIAQASASRLGVRRDLPQIRETYFDQ